MSKNIIDTKKNRIMVKVKVITPFKHKGKTVPAGAINVIPYDDYIAGKKYLRRI